MEERKENESYRDKADEVREPAALQIEYGKTLHRRSYEVEEVCVICAEDTVYPEHNENESAEDRHVFAV